VIELLGCRLLKPVDFAALRIDSRHDEPDGPVLSGCIHRLKDHQNGPQILSVEQFRQLLEADNVRRQDCVGPFLDCLKTVGIRGS